MSWWPFVLDEAATEPAKSELELGWLEYFPDDPPDRSDQAFVPWRLRAQGRFRYIALLFKWRWFRLQPGIKVVVIGIGKAAVLVALLLTSAYIFELFVARPWMRQTY